MITIYHNPKCSKSRETLDLMRSKGHDPRVVEYLKTPPAPGELDAICQALNKEPRDIVRTKEDAYRDLNLQDKPLTRAQWLETIAANPILLERPIVVNGKKAAIGRPPENVLAVLE